LNTKEELRFCDNGNAHIADASFLKSLEDRIIRAFHDVGTSIGYRACSAALWLTLLHGEVFHSFHKVLGSDRPISEVGRPIHWSRREDHVTSFFADEYFPCVELKFFGQPDGLIAVVHEDLCGSSMFGPLDTEFRDMVRESGRALFQEACELDLRPAAR
jgi:hypothetical protein